MVLTSTRERALLVAMLLSLVLWNLPFGGLILYPFKILATWLHEMSHGLMMLTTGVGFEHLQVYRDTSGIAVAQSAAGPVAKAAIASAGYVGTAAFGALFLVLGQSSRGARRILGALAAALVLSALLWMGNEFGIAAVLAGAIALVAIAVFAPEKGVIFTVNFIAAQACTHALLDIRVLFRANLVVNGQNLRLSDAHNMAAATFAGPRFWAVIWLLWSLLLFYIALRLVRVERTEALAVADSLSDQGTAST